MFKSEREKFFQITLSESVKVIFVDTENHVSLSGVILLLQRRI